MYMGAINMYCSHIDRYKSITYDHLKRYSDYLSENIGNYVYWYQKENQEVNRVLSESTKC